MPSSEYAKRLQVPWYLSWPFIVVSMIFWPLGVLLLVMRLARDRHASISTGRILKVVGIVVMLVFAIGGYSYYQEQQNLYGDTLGREGEFVVGLAITFTLLGFILWRFGNKLVYRGKMVREYLDVIVNKRFFEIDEIARIVSKRPDKVASEIGFLIRTGYLPDAYLNEGAKRVVVPAVERHLAMEADLERRMEAQTGEARQSEAPSANHRISETPERSAVPPVPRLVTCRSCGANNIVTPGHPRECEFCGSLISE
jgi:hypothetical protein